MNPHQLMKRKRLERCFSTGDGVRLADGRVGVVRAVGEHTGEDGYFYSIEVSGQADWVSEHDANLTSEPGSNTGKYGGPARGGASGGLAGESQY